MSQIRILAERQMGEFLKTMPKATGTRGQLEGRNPDGSLRSGGSSSAPPEAGGKLETLSNLGITKKESARAQKLAAIPESYFHERIAVVKAFYGRDKKRWS